MENESFRVQASRKELNQARISEIPSVPKKRAKIMSEGRCFS